MNVTVTTVERKRECAVCGQSTKWLLQSPWTKRYYCWDARNCWVQDTTDTAVRLAALREEEGMAYFRAQGLVPMQSTQQGWCYVPATREVVKYDHRGSWLVRLSERTILRDSPRIQRHHPAAVEAWFDYWAAQAPVEWPPTVRFVIAMGFSQ